MSHGSKQPSLLEELKRRRVFRVAILYCFVGWLLIQIGEATFEPLGLPDGSLRLVIILVILGLPIAIAMGWVFDVTPEGVVRTSSNPAAGETRIPVRHRMTLIIVLAALLAVGISVWRPDRLPEPVAPTTGSELRADPTSQSARFLHPPLPDKPSIVVLPFDNMSDDPGQEYFVDGLTEELTGKLAGVWDLFVIARNSAFAYKGHSVDVKQIGSELGVRYVLEGSAQKSSDRLRVTAQLIDARSGFHIWSESYDRDATDLLDLQSEIALEILGALRIEIEEAELERIRSKPTTSLTAHDLVTRALPHCFALLPSEHPKCRRLLEEAVELDPAYASALALLGMTYTAEFAAWSGDPALIDIGESWIRKALAVDANEVSAVLLMAFVDIVRGRIPQARIGAEKAIRLAPSFEVPRISLGMITMAEGDWEGARETLEYAMRLNPNGHVGNRSLLAEAYYRLGRTGEAIELWEEVRARNPAHLQSRVALVDHYVSVGDVERAR